MIYRQLLGYLHSENFINDYVLVTYCIVTPNIRDFIRELCISISILTSTDMSQLLEYICTI